jgi:hypothetical protein
MNKLLMKSLTNEMLSLIYIEVIRQRGDIVIHFTDKMDHISGYYLLRITCEGMSKFEDVGNIDRHRQGDIISSIEADEMRRLKIVGVDLV